MHRLTWDLNSFHIHQEAHLDGLAQCHLVALPLQLTHDRFFLDFIGFQKLQFFPQSLELLL